MAQTLPFGSTLTIALVGLRNQVTNVYPDDATVTLETLAHADAIVSLTGVPMPYVAGTTGRNTTYRGVIGADDLNAEGLYTGTVKAVIGADTRRFRVEVHIKAKLGV